MNRWEPASGATRRLVLEGALDAAAVASQWDAVVEVLRGSPPQEAVIDMSRVQRCDGAGLAMLAEITRIISSTGGKVSFTGAPAAAQSMIAAMASAPLPPRRPTVGLIEQVGIGVQDSLAGVRQLVEFTGEVVRSAWAALGAPATVRWKDVLSIAARTGFDAVGVTCLLGFIIGFIIAFQTLPSFQTYGAGDMVAVVIGVAMVRELGPLITGVVLAGRSGSAFAAELGTMTVTNEIDALRTFGLDPVRFLVIPRMLAAMLTTPFLSLFCTFLGLLGGLAVMAPTGMSTDYFVQEVQGAVDATDLLQGMFKAAVFAMLVSGAGCGSGLATGAGPGAVGQSATRAVVAGIVLVILSDGVMGWLFFLMGI